MFLDPQMGFFFFVGESEALGEADALVIVAVPVDPPHHDREIGAWAAESLRDPLVGTVRAPVEKHGPRELTRPEKYLSFLQQDLKSKIFHF